MSKILIALSVAAVLASPALAGGRLDANPAVLADPAQLGGAASVDTVVTQSVTADGVAGTDAQTGPTRPLFGADSR